MHLVVGIEVNRLYISCVAGRCNRHHHHCFCPFSPWSCPGGLKQVFMSLSLSNTHFVASCLPAQIAEGVIGGRAGRKENGESEQYGYGPEEAWESGDAGLEQRER